MNTALWITQIILALVFLGAGFVKLTKSREFLEPRMTYVEDMTDSQVTITGVVEVLGALGLVLPGLTGIAPILTPIAASGLVIVMIVAAALHVKRDEMPNIAVNVLLAAMAAFVAWGRFGEYAL
ncbi:MAG TPA: DoxX family protein [Nitriliruptoraceae bacterium]|nr:DoxX family protein [Nitriliruptoraceae bacterium]